MVLRWSAIAVRWVVFAVWILENIQPSRWRWRALWPVNLDSWFAQTVELAVRGLRRRQDEDAPGVGDAAEQAEQRDLMEEGLALHGL